MSVYINRRNADGSPFERPRDRTGRRRPVYNETVSQCASFPEARAEARDLRESDPTGVYWLSNRPCKNWRSE